MLTNRATKTLVKNSFARPFVRTISAESITRLLVFSSILLVPSPLFAQQRVVVEKATGNVVDAGDGSLQYDSRYFDHVDLLNSPIPPGENLRKYMRNAAGAIVLRPKDELTKNFADEWRNDLITRINGLVISPEIKELLLDIVKGMRR